MIKGYEFFLTDKDSNAVFSEDGEQLTVIISESDFDYAVELLENTFPDYYYDDFIELD